MLCDICKKNRATLHIKNNINGIIIEKDICTDCYNKTTSGDYTTTLAHVFQSFTGAGFDKLSDKKCSACGTKLSSILETLFVGCPVCYRELGDFILPSIKKVQNACLHEGKRPLGRDDTRHNEYERLLSELSAAVESENFEQAAIISARLKQLQGDF